MSFDVNPVNVAVKKNISVMFNLMHTVRTYTNV